MAIAFDVTATGGANFPVDTSLTTGSTSASATVGIVFVDINSATDAVSSIAWDTGNLMTFIGKLTATNQIIEVWAILSPPSGAKTVTITGSGTSSLISFATSYTGQTAPTLPSSGNIASASAGTGTSTSATLTTASNNSWAVGCHFQQVANNDTFSAGLTRRIGNNGAGGSSRLMGDSNAAITPAGALVCTATWVGSGNNGLIVVELPVGAASGPTNVKTWDGVTQSTGVKTYEALALASTKSVIGVT